MSSSSTPRTDPAVARWMTPARLASLIGVLLAAYAALQMLRALRGILLMLLVAVFLSFAMEPAVQFLARHRWRRGPATGVVFLVVGAATVGAVAAMVPLLVDQVSELASSLPRIVEQSQNWVAATLGEGGGSDGSTALADPLRELGNQLSGGVDSGALLGAAGNVVNVGATAVGLIAQLFAVLLVTFYLVADGPRARRVLARPFPPESQREMLAVWELAVAKTGGYIYSRVLLALACGLTHGVFFFALGVDYAYALAIWVGLTSAFIPLIGTYIGGVLPLLVALASNPLDALWILVFIAAYQQLENYVLAPHVQAHTMQIHPAVAFVSVLVGATLLGAVGALLALPATAIGQALLQTYVRRHEVIDELGGGEDPTASRPDDAGTPARAGDPEPSAEPSAERNAETGTAEPGQPAAAASGSSTRDASNPGVATGEAGSAATSSTR